MKDKKFETVNCYYCGRLVRLDKAVVIYVSPKLKPDVPNEQSPVLIMSSPMKIYICPACARYRGISKKELRIKEKGEEILKKLGIEI